MTTSSAIIFSFGVSLNIRLVNETGFSSKNFVEAVIAGNGNNGKAFCLSVTGSGISRSIYGLETPQRRGLRKISLAPLWLYASPGWEGGLDVSMVKALTRQLTTAKTLLFEWTVRFDHTELFDAMKGLGFKYSDQSTQILHLTTDYAEVFSRFKAETRRKIRRSYNEGTVVLRSSDDASISAFHDLYSRNQLRTGRRTTYSLAMFRELARLDTTKLLIARNENQVVAGGMFLDDGDSTYYWLGVNDRDFDKAYPTHAILDVAIKDACRSKKKFVDFGASKGLASLEEFKSFWGAVKVPYWRFVWRNPYWNFLFRMRLKATNLRRAISIR